MFYTYVLLDPRKPGRYFYSKLSLSLLYQPFYVGKGKDNRIRKHSRYYTGKNYYKRNTIAAIHEQSLEPIELIIFSGTEIECFELEKMLISSMGRYPEGILTNMTDGGEGCSSPSPSVLAKRGKKISQAFNSDRENRLKLISDTLNTPEVLSKRTFTMRTEEIRKKRRDHMNIQWSDEEYRESMSTKMKSAIANESKETRERRIKSATSDAANKKRSDSLKRTWAKRKAENKVTIPSDVTIDNQQPSLK
jgi:hypothetical protein